MMNLLLLTPQELLGNGMVLSAIAFSVAITALSYMAGEFFSMPSLKAFSKTELVEMGMTLLIFLIALALILPNGPFDMIAKGFMIPPLPGEPEHICSEWKTLHQISPGVYDSNIAFAEGGYFLGCRLNFAQLLGGAISNLWTDPGDGIMLPKITRGYMQLMNMEILLGGLSTLGFGVGIRVGVIYVVPVYLNIGGIMPFIGLTLISEIHTVIVDALAAAWSAFAAQAILLSFIEEAVLKFFLPFGMLLRAFPFTRKTGSTVLALVFAAYFIFPISVLMDQQIYHMLQNPQKVPNCRYAGDWCVSDSQCCSGRCSILSGGSLFKCQDAFTDFTEYQSTYSMCHGKDPAAIKQDWKKTEDLAVKYVDEIYADDPSFSEPTTKTQKRLEGGYEEMEKRSAITQKYGVGDPNLPDSMISYILPDPTAVTKWAFNFYETAVMDSSKYVVIGVIFIIMEIVLTMTLFKDFAILIGGEPRIFGLSRLV